MTQEGDTSAAAHPDVTLPGAVGATAPCAPQAVVLANLLLRVTGLEHLVDRAVHEATAAPRDGLGVGFALVEDGEQSERRSSSGGSVDASTCIVVDPAAGIMRARSDFEEAQTQADAALCTAITRQSQAAAKRAEHVQAALVPLLASRAPHLDTRRWALEAEKLRVTAQLAEVQLAKWYMRVIVQATEGGRVAVSRGEAAVLMRVKDHIQLKRTAFNEQALLRLVEALPRSELEHADTHRAVMLLREEVGLSPEVLRDFMHMKHLPVPLALRVGRGMRGDVRGSTHTGGGASSSVGSDAPRASMRLSHIGQNAV